MKKQGRYESERLNKAEALAWWKEDQELAQLSSEEREHRQRMDLLRREREVRKEARRRIAALKPVVAKVKHEERYRGNEEHQARCWRCRQVLGWQRRDRRVQWWWRQQAILGKAVFERNVRMGRFCATQRYLYEKKQRWIR
jgi:hypothetical protein